ncbi:L,D-transpeptidase [Nakamurella antarctica]|uniref:L,D-transpeptidase n=1 Tax=Nakamurella antarctica TaxID=1902245 RepID=A0A3G8ZQE6_9ACTN|nr:L,D-transpeptidase [Nakamurella antarctica]
MRRSLSIIAVGVAAVLTVGACSSTGQDVVVTEFQTAGANAAPAPSQVTVPPTQSVAVSSAPAASAAAPAAAKVNIISLPAFGSTDLAPATPITVTVFNADITGMTVTGSDGSALKGDISADGATFTLSQGMKYGQTYNFVGVAKGTDGTETPITGTMATVAPTDTNRAAITPSQGETVGVAAPIVIQFYGQVKDRAAAQRALTVTAVDKSGAPLNVEGSWGWLQDEEIKTAGVLQSQVHFRPKDFWPAYTTVTVKANLYGVNLGGTWGREDVSQTFTIGRDLRVDANVSSFRMKVTVDGAQVQDFPVSYGKTEDVRRATRNGIHIVQEKFPDYDMCNTQFNYCGVKVKWAVRINNNGEFIHENDSTIPQQGVANVSHGCVNMSTANAKIFYDMALYGDPVTVSNSPGAPDLGPADYNYDWSYTYDQWKKFSAL